MQLLSVGTTFSWWEMWIQREEEFIVLLFYYPAWTFTLPPDTAHSDSHATLSLTCFCYIT